MTPIQAIRQFLCILVAAFAISLPAYSQLNAAKPITLVVAFPPGGGMDTLARIIQPKLQEKLQRTVLVVNKPGGGGVIAAQYLMNAPADGATYMITISSFALNQVIRKDAGYDVTKDFAPVTQIALSAPILMVVNGASPIRNVSDLLARAKSEPNERFYGSVSIGSISHIGGELLNKLSGTVHTHVPFKGAAEAMNGLMSGQVDFVLIDELTATPLLASGRIRAIAVTSAERSPFRPDIPAVGETVQGYDVGRGWIGMFAPTSTPSKLVNEMHDAIREILVQPDVREKVDVMGTLPPSSTPVEFRNVVRTFIAKWEKTIPGLDLKVN